jgi:hypothetical protein
MIAGISMPNAIHEALTSKLNGFTRFAPNFESFCALFKSVDQEHKMTIMRETQQP